MEGKTAAVLTVLVAAGLVGSYLALTSPSPRNGSALTPLKSIPLTNISGRLDHMDVDPVTQRLFLAAVNDGSLEVIDLRNGNVTRFGGFTGAHGVLFSQKHQMVYLTVDNGTVYALSADTLKPVTSLKLSSDADNIRYESSSDRVWVGFGQGQGAGLAVITATSFSLYSTVVLGAHPESFQLDTESGLVFANVPTLGQIVGVSVANLSVTTRWHTQGYLDNFPMALDPNHHLVLVGTWFPATALAYSEGSFALVSHIGVCGDADDIYFVTRTSTLLASCGQGFIDVVRVDDTSLSVTSTIATSAGARTSLYSPDLNEYFVAAPSSGGQSARLLVYAPRPP